MKSRIIQDCLAWAYEYFHHCHKSRKKVVALKLDFEKNFDKVDHSFIMAVLQAKGFGTQWCLWIQQILDSTTSAILLNGQGHPFSPLLFVLAANVLQYLVNPSMQNESLHHPLNLQCSTTFPIIQYDDDTLIIMQADTQQVHHLTEVLQTFGAASS
jgi:hypothetical protein